MRDASETDRLQAEACRLRSGAVRLSIHAIANRLKIRSRTVSEWLRAIDEAYEQQIQPELRLRFEQGETVDQLALHYQLELRRAKSMVADLLDDELQRLSQLLIENPTVPVKQLHQHFSRWSLRTLRHYAHRLLPRSETESYRDPCTDECYMSLNGLAVQFGVHERTLSLVLSQPSREVRYVRVVKSRSKWPAHYYSVTDLLEKHPRFRRHEHLAQLFAKDDGNVLGQVPDDLRPSSWAVLLTMLLLRRNRGEWPSDYEMFRALKSKFQYRHITISNARYELRRTGYLSLIDGRWWATSRCPIDFISYAPEKEVGYPYPVRVYFDFVESSNRVVMDRTAGGSSQPIQNKLKLRRSRRRGPKQQ